MSKESIPVQPLEGPKELLEAVRNNDLFEIERLIGENSNLLNHIYPSHNRTILLIACSENGVEAETVRKLLQLGANCTDSRSDYHWEAIHFAAAQCSFKILEVLLQDTSICINALDQFGNNALHHLIRSNENSPSDDFLKCVETLIKNGIDAQQLNLHGITPLELITDDSVRISITEMFQFKKTDLENPTRQLQKYINEENEEKCIEEINKITDLSLVNECYPGTSSTLLQLCCTNGLFKVVKHLLNIGADPTKTTEKNTKESIYIAVEIQRKDILEALLKYYDISRIDIKLLIKILKGIDNIEIDYKGCYRVLINKIKTYIPEDQRFSPKVVLKINETDSINNSPLHYAIWFADTEIIRELLDLGAFLGTKNKYGDMPIKDIEFDTLKTHLDDCIIIDSTLNKYEENFKVKLIMRSLKPFYSENIRNPEEDPEAPTPLNIPNSKKRILDTEVVSFMASSPELRKLLPHPVIVSFLIIKWCQYQWLFWINLVFYFIFAISFILSIITDYCNFTGIFLYISYYGSWVSVGILALRELVQIAIEKLNYFKKLDNYAELTLISIAILTLSNIYPSYNAKRQLWSASILLLSWELLEMLGKHPWFSTHIVMLRTVTMNFFSSLFCYSLLIIAFSFSFYFLFNTNGAKNQTDNENFNSIGDSIFKTIIMLTGEFDSSSLNFDTIFMINKLIFIFFIFVIHLILLNLLNGLAVSDTQQIRGEAQLFGHIARIMYIKNIENIMTEYDFLSMLMNKSRKLLGYIYNIQNEVVHDELTYFPKKNNLSLNSETKNYLYNIIQNKYKRHR